MLTADMIMIPLALWSAFALRLGELTPDVSQFWWMFPLAPLISIPIFIRMGFYRAIIRFLGIDAVNTVIKGVALSAVILAAIVLLSGVKGVPRSVFFIFWGVCVLYVGGSRMLMRSYYRSLVTPRDTRKPLIIYGAGESGIQLASALAQGNDSKPVAFLDENAALQGSEINGIRVFHPDELPELIKNFKVQQILLAMPTISRSKRREILEKLEMYPVHIRTIPGMDDLVTGRAKVNDLREIDIEDLLGRNSVAPDPQLLGKNIRHKVVLVTGAGGSIGSELCRQILVADPAVLILYEISEFSLYQMEEELHKLITKSHSPTRLVPLLGNVLDDVKLHDVMKGYGVDTVYHAAAYKHVPIVEANVAEGVRNNILGTCHTAKAAIEAGVETFVLISTDKAVRPTNVMGASKRFAELILQALAADTGKQTTGERATSFVMVRFGNVLGSSGSVVPLFRRQIREEGVVKVTHPEVIRYFMTIREASQLVIQAGAMGQGGDVFVLEMGKPVKILDLAVKMIHLSGLMPRDEENPDGDIEIRFTGLRPGEKLYEELLIGDNVTRTRHPRIMKAEEWSLSLEEISEDLAILEKLIAENRVDEIIGLLRKTLRDYVPKEEIHDLLWSQANNPASLTEKQGSPD